MKRLLLTTALATIAILPVAQANTIGSVAAVNRDIEGVPPGAAKRALLLGDNVLANERLISSPDGSGQLLFLDQTSLTVSPNSDIVLDKYVYDPSSQSGEIALTVSKGVLRMIGGRITKSNPATIRTPAATIGIRGGIGLVAYENGQTSVMHVAGEFTRVEAGGQILNITRANGFATIGADGVPVFQGVANEVQIAAFYNRMQGGGGGAETPPVDADIESAGVAQQNSEEPNAVASAPISTQGESEVSDNAVEVEQGNTSSDTEVVVVPEESDSEMPVEPTPTPPEPTPTPVDPFANFTGGLLLVSPGQSFTTTFGETIDDAVAQNFLIADDALLFTSVEEGSIIGTLEGGEGTVTLPTPAISGFFDFGLAETDTSVGQLQGTAFADLESGVLAYYFTTQAGDIGLSLFAEPGPKQMRNINVGNNQFRTTSFNVIPDLHTSGTSMTTVPFLPTGFGETFDNGERTQITLISPDDTELFGDGFGSPSFTGTKSLLPVFRVSGNDANQEYLMFVGASRILNNGTDAPALTLFTRGSTRDGGANVPSRVQSALGSQNLSEGATDGGISVLGADDDYLLLSNSGTYFDFADNPEEEDDASRITAIDGSQQILFGNTQLIQRDETTDFAIASRISIGADVSEFTAELGRNSVGNIPTTLEARFLTQTYASGAATFGSNQGFDRFLMRTTAIEGPGGSGFFETDSADGAITLELDTTVDSQDIFALSFAFGGSRSAVINGATFGMREHNAPSTLEDILLPSGQTTNIISTSGGDFSGRAPNNGETALRAGLLSHGLADASSLYPAGTPQTPQYLTWGWWTGQFRFENTGSGDQFDNSRLQFSLNPWVGGNRTNVVPSTGIATFNGAVTVNVLDANGADFVDGGQFELQYDFGQGLGTATFQNVANLPDVVVPVDSGLAAGRNHYGGLLSGTDITTFVDGSFFDGPNTNDALATAGGVSITRGSDNFIAEGVFWGER